MTESPSIPQWRGQPLSRMMLGTVQFGMEYGIANRSGKPDYDEVLEILKTAVDGGVNSLDTAAAYGTSEEVLGRALKQLGLSERLFVVTKVRPLTPEELANPDLAEAAIDASVNESRRRLQLDLLPGVLFHREEDAAYGEVLIGLRQRGLLEHAGVSCNNFPGPATKFVESGLVTALQIPGNILDRRHQKSGIFAQAASHGIALFLRSVYLQGLLVMSESDIPPHLTGIVPFRRKLDEFGKQAGILPAELALRYMLAQPGVISILTGVESVSQVRENLRLFKRGPLSEDLVAAIDSISLEPDDFLITPGKWATPQK